MQKQVRPSIGLRQARRICQLSDRERLNFIADGLPVILESAQGFWKAAQQLERTPREALVLEGFATEEAAKILILMDIVRCPITLLKSKLRKLIDLFYDHLARLIYAQASTWKPSKIEQLREYVDHSRQGHYTDGFAGEFIVPNWTVYERESRLYADVEATQYGSLVWSAPRSPYNDDLKWTPVVPSALHLAEAMRQLGLFSPGGLNAISEIWGSVEFRYKEGPDESRELTKLLFKRIDAEKLCLESATEDHASTLFWRWQIPMYNLDFSLIPVTLEELEEQQERALRSEIGDTN